jgi:hypothetical protein
MSSPARFNAYFPFASKVVGNPLAAAVPAVPLALIAGVWSVHYALAVVLAWQVILAFYLERRILDFCLLPPFAALFLWQFLALGVGIPLIISESTSTFDPAFLRMQLIWVLGFPVFYAAYALFFRRVQAVVVPIPTAAPQHQAWRVVFVIGWLLLIMRITGFVVGALTGAEDRGEFNVTAMTDQKFGIWTAFHLLPRFSNVGFVLLPVLFARSSAPGRLVLAGMVGVYLVFALVSGGRGHLFYPLLFVLIGYYAFRPVRRLPLDAVMFALALLFLPLIAFIGSYRGTEGFVGTRMSDVRGRVAAMRQTRDVLASEVGGRTVTGTALLGVNDTMIYEATPQVVPHARWENFNAILFTWIPTFVWRDKPILLDGNAITSQYIDYELGRSGATVSLGADLYRRFGWLGVAVGMPLAFVLFGALSWFCYDVYLRRNFTVGVVLVIFTISFASWSPLQTVLTTWWNFTYDTPRHLLALGAIYFVVVQVVGRYGNRGALAYWGQRRPVPAEDRSKVPAISP